MTFIFKFFFLFLLFLFKKKNLGSLAACNVFVFPGICMVSLARRHLNGYYAKMNNDRRLLQNLEGTRTWRYIWNFSYFYGVFIIFFGIAMFVLVFVQVGIDITSVTTGGNESEFTCL